MPSLHIVALTELAQAYRTLARPRHAYDTPLTNARRVAADHIIAAMRLVAETALAGEPRRSAPSDERFIDEFEARREERDAARWPGERTR